MKKLNCFVTGASSGIGKEISVKLSKYAKHIYISSRDLKELEKVHDKYWRMNASVQLWLNLENENGIENLAKQIFKR